MIKRLMVICLACFGSAEDFLATRQGAEADFWQRSRGSVLQAARKWPGGMGGWWWVAKRFALRFLLPPLLVFSVAVTLLLAGFGGWVAVREQADAEAQSEASKQAFDALERVRGKMLAALCPHFTSRENDAHLHIHAVIMNIVQRLQMPGPSAFSHMD